MRRKRLILHESTQRQLCRCLLLFLGLIPLVAILGFVVVSKTSWYTLRQKAAWRERIRENLGLDVVFDSIEFPSPNRFRIKELMCIHPETQQPIFFSPSVHGEMTHRGWSVDLASAQLVTTQTDLALKIIHDSFLCRPHNAVPILKLSIESLSIGSLTSGALPKEIKHSHEIAWPPLEKVLVEYEPGLNQSQIKIRFGLASLDSAPAKVDVVRDHSVNNPRTFWAIQTQETALPCSALSGFMPSLAYLGPDALFRGEVKFQQTIKNDWVCQVKKANFDRVKLESLTALVGSPIRGESRLEVRDSTIVSGHIQQAKVSLVQSKSVSVDGNWIRSIARTFRWAIDDRVNELTEGKYPVSALKLNFDLDDKGLLWTGQGDPIEGKDQLFRVLAIVDGHHRVATGSLVGRIPLHQITPSVVDSQQGASSETIAQLQSSLTSLLPVPLQSTQQFPRLSETTSRPAPR